MKYEIGDRVKIKDDLKVGTKYNHFTFVSEMEKYTGEEAIVIDKKASIYNTDKGYYYLIIEGATVVYKWTDDMLEPVVDIIGYIPNGTVPDSVINSTLNIRDLHINEKGVSIEQNSIIASRAEEYGILDIWFSPVYKAYEPRFKVDDWVYIIKTELGARGAEKQVGRITNKKASNGLSSDYTNGINVEIRNRVWGIGKDYSTVKLRKATDKEIAEAIKILYFGDVPFTIEVGYGANTPYGYITVEELETMVDFINKASNPPTLAGHALRYKVIHKSGNDIITIGCKKGKIRELKDILAAIKS